MKKENYDIFGLIQFASEHPDNIMTISEGFILFWTAMWIFGYRCKSRMKGA